MQSNHTLRTIRAMDDIHYEDCTSGGDRVLGLVAETSVLVADHTAYASDCHIAGSIFVRSSSFEPGNYNKSSGNAGRCGYVRRLKNRNRIPEFTCLIPTACEIRIQVSVLSGFLYKDLLHQQLVGECAYPEI